MALTAPPRVCGPCFRGRVWATAYATRSPSSRRNWWPSRRQSARRSARSSIRCSTRRDSGRACGCLRSASGSATLLTTSPPWLGQPMASGSGSWFQDKKSGWYAVLEDPQMPAMSTVLDQAHNAIDRKLFMMKYFHHPGGSQAAFLTGLAHLYNLIPYQRRAQNGGQCGVEVEGGRLPDIRLDAQPANPHLRRLSVCARASVPLNPGECGKFRDWSIFRVMM